MHKIAFFIGDLLAQYQRDVTEALVRVFKQEGYQLNVFTHFGAYGDNYLYADGEKSIYRIPYLEDYSGIILASDTFEIKGMYDELSALIEKTVSCPVISLRREDSRFYNVLIDDYTAISRMIEHFINDHGFSRICFMTGKIHMKDAQNRLKGYIDTMGKYGIPITNDMIFHGDYWKNRGAEAVEQFLNNQLPPQAIVCSNDYMAIAVCDELLKRGFHIPDDICVSGYDDVEESRFTTPTLTSMNVPCDEIGQIAGKMIIALIHGQKVEDRVYTEAHECYRASCGCTQYVENNTTRLLFQQREYLYHVLYQTAYMNIDFENTNNFEELINVAHRYATNVSYKEIYLCFNKKENVTDYEADINYSDEMVLRVIMSQNNVTFHNKVFNRRTIIPEEYLIENEALYTIPMHDKNKCIGYLVMKLDATSDIKRFFQVWVLGLSSALEAQNMYAMNKELMELRAQYSKDVLTGIYNRREMEKILRYTHAQMKNGHKGFCIISIDMDRLKIINDTYGHLEGDSALCALANILKETIGTLGEAARVGGDEYTICVYSDEVAEIEEIISKIREGIEHYNEVEKKPYQLSASIGYALCFEYDKLVAKMEEADRNMYREKREKKKAYEKQN